MPHILIITKLNLIKGNASSGVTVDLIAAVNAAQTLLDGDIPRARQTAITAKLEQIEGVVVHGTEIQSGIVETFQQFTTELAAL